MTGRDSGQNGDIDEIDRRILGILAGDPRIPYSDISGKLAEEGYRMSSEAIRQRVTSLFEITTSFFLLRPDNNDWEIVMFTIETANHPGAKQEAFEALSDFDFWFVGSGFGSIDIYATATVDSTAGVDELLTRVRELEMVTNVDYFIETNRSTDVEKYLRVE